MDNSQDFDSQNASVLAEMLEDPSTSEATRLQIINSLLKDGGTDTFFETMFKENLSLGKCPFCSHENYWLIPEDDLNQMGWVSNVKDTRVKGSTNKEDCPEFQESCKKKKTTA